MSPLSLLMIVAAAVGAPTPAPARHESQAYLCDFEDALEPAFAEWSRRRGAGFPLYVPIDVTAEDHDGGRQSLRIGANGASAEVVSPMLPVDPRLSYAVETSVRMKNIRAMRARVSLTIYDADRNPIDQRSSESIASADEWTKLRLGPLNDLGDRARFITISLEAIEGDQLDLDGAIYFDDVRLLSMPAARLQLGGGRRFYALGDAVEASLEIDGWPGESPAARWTLEDALGDVVARSDAALQPIEAPEGAKLALADEEAGKKFSTTWAPEIRLPGYYRVRVEVSDARGSLSPLEAALVVVDGALAPRSSEFGWSIDEWDDALEGELPRLLELAGARRVMLPMWEADPQRRTRVRSFVLQLARREVESIGVLAPTESVLRELPLPGDDAPRNLFARDVSQWRGALEPVLLDLSPVVRRWTLGDGRNTAGLAEGAAAAPKVRRSLAELGFQIELAAPAVIDDFAVAELATTAMIGADGRMWLTLAPVDRMANDPRAPRSLTFVADDATNSSSVLSPVEARAAAWLHRIRVAKELGAAAIFIRAIDDPTYGVVTARGEPGELFMPWRTAAIALGGATPIGAVPLPGRSENVVFVRDREAVMMIWRAAPGEETLFLGKNAVQIDAWGRSRPMSGEAQTVEVGPLPSFVVGVDAAVCRLRQSVAFEQPRLASIPREIQDNAITLQNTFDRPLRGEATLRLPAGWDATPTTFAIDLAPGESLRQPISITLPATVQAGAQPVEIVFNVTAGEPYRFSAYEELTIGHDDFQIALSSRRLLSGDLEVIQTLTNNAEAPITVRCQLFAPGRRGQGAFVSNLIGEDTRTFRLENADELRGEKLWLRVEELDGPRVFNYAYEPDVDRTE